jgi:L-aspartate oxidase
MRHESRGLHYSRDYPEMMPVGGNTIINPRPGLLCPGACEALMPEL